MAVLLVIDDNVNARVICEVLLQARGEVCHRCGETGPHLCDSLLSHADVTIVESDFLNDDRSRALRALLQEVKGSQPSPPVVVVSDRRDRIERAGIMALTDEFLPSDAVGRDLLPILDALRGRAGSPLAGAQ